jgi:L-iditol 2-dehydrogenase
MKALVLEEYGKLGIKDVQKPEVTGDKVLIRVKAVAICGSDIHGFNGSSGRRKPPIIMGHEASGIVEEMGPLAKGFKAGDRVTFNSTEYCGKCRYCSEGKQNMCIQGAVYGVSCEEYQRQGAMAEYIAVPDYLIYHLPESVSFIEATMVEPLSIALHAVGKACLMIADTAVIFGAGTIGSMLIKLLKISSCSRLITVDIDQHKLEFARKQGVDYCINAAKDNVVKKVFDITNGYGADVAFEAVGIESTVKAGIQALKKCGTLTLLGNVSKYVEFPLQEAVVKEIKIISSFACSSEYEKSLYLIESGQVVVNDLISITAPLDEGQELFQKLVTGGEGFIKVVLTI